MDDDARAYIDAIAPRQRPLFDRFHGLVPVSYTHLTLPTTPYV